MAMNPLVRGDPEYPLGVPSEFRDADPYQTRLHTQITNGSIRPDLP